MSRIAILGWGSLIKQPKRLPLQGGWKSDGPVLKIEFSRISNDGRLTLVIDPLGSEIKTYHARSARTELDDAICDLMIRERTSKENIGICSKNKEQNCSKNHPNILPVVQSWLDQRDDIDALIWTDLESNYRKKRKVDFVESDALAYLDNLSPICRAHARDYIIQAPEQTQTKFRKHLQSKGWL